MAAVTDSLGDMLTRVRNALVVEHESVDIPASKLKIEVARILKDEGFIRKYTVLSRGIRKVLRIDLKYGPNKEKVISLIKRVSKPGRRIYMAKSEIPKILNGYGISIMTTPKGVMTGRDARKNGIGGEVICQVW